MSAVEKDVLIVISGTFKLEYLKLPNTWIWKDTDVLTAQELIRHTDHYMIKECLVCFINSINALSGNGQ